MPYRSTVMLIITYNNNLISSDEDLANAIAEDIIDSNRYDEIMRDISSSRTLANPDDANNAFSLIWSDEEPAIAENLRFSLAPGVSNNAEVIEAPSEDVGTSLAKVAGASLVDGFNDHFFFDGDTGFLAVNPANPPTLQESAEVVSRLVNIHHAAGALEDFSSWQTGALIHSIELSHGEEFSLSQYCEINEENYNRMITALNTFKFFQNQRYDLSFSHHKEAFYTKNLEDDQIHSCLNLAQNLNMSIRDFRKLLRFVKVNGITRDITNAENKEQLLETLVNSDPDLRQRYLICMNGQWFKTKTMRDSIPSDFQTLICLDNGLIETPDGQSELTSLNETVTSA